MATITATVLKVCRYKLRTHLYFADGDILFLRDPLLFFVSLKTSLKSTVKHLSFWCHLLLEIVEPLDDLHVELKLSIGDVCYIHYEIQFHFFQMSCENSEVSFFIVFVFSV